MIVRQGGDPGPCRLESSKRRADASILAENVLGERPYEAGQPRPDLEPFSEAAHQVLEQVCGSP